MENASLGKGQRAPKDADEDKQVAYRQIEEISMTKRPLVLWVPYNLTLDQKVTKTSNEFWLDEISPIFAYSFLMKAKVTEIILKFKNFLRSNSKLPKLFFQYEPVQN